MTTLDEIRRHAMDLPEPERAALARDLLASLEASAPDEGAAAAWADEAEARAEAHDRGEIASADWRESTQRLRDELAGGRPS